MDSTVYEALEDTFRTTRCKTDYIECVSRNHTNVSRETMLSIYSQCYQHHVKKTLPKYRKPNVMFEIYQKVKPNIKFGDVDCAKYKSAEQEENALLNLSVEIDVAPTLAARMVLECLEDNSELCQSDNRSALISKWLKNPSMISSSLLSRQVTRCVEGDSEYGPLGEHLKHSVGYEYEYYLEECLRSHGIPFKSERTLRRQNFDKTPDFRLEPAIMVGGHPVHWFESKALFGDTCSHQRHLEDQLRSYQNRFGSGVVVYWFGFVKGIKLEDGVLVYDHFPANEISSI